jgi:hypothetical protein
MNRHGVTGSRVLRVVNLCDEVDDAFSASSSSSPRVMSARMASITALTAVETAKTQAGVELARVKAENTRLRAQHREDERRNRQGTYHRLLAVWNRLDAFATGYPPESDDQFRAAVDEASFLTSGVHMFGSPDVREAVRQVEHEFAVEIGNRMGHADASGPQFQRFIDAYRPRRRQLIAAQDTVSHRHPVGRPVPDAAHNGCDQGAPDHVAQLGQRHTVDMMEPVPDGSLGATRRRLLVLPPGSSPTTDRDGDRRQRQPT